MRNARENIDENKDVTVDEKVRMFLFFQNFEYVRSTDDFMIGSTADVKNRIIKAAKSMNYLTFICDTKDVPLHAKIMLINRRVEIKSNYFARKENDFLSN